MDKVLLSVVDRRLVFMFFRQPLHTMPVSTPYSRLQHHRLKLERLLSNESEVEKAFTSFTPMVPQVNQKEWRKPWQIKLWLEEQQRSFNRKFNLPQKPDTSNVSEPSENRDTTMVHTNSDLVNAFTSDMLAARPGGSEISVGLCLYSLATRLARDYISADPAPEVVKTFAHAMFTLIAKLARHLEIHLQTNLPKPDGQFPAVHGDEVAAGTLLLDPTDMHNLLENGIIMVMVGLESEHLSLAGWSCIATEVHQGKVAFQTAFEEYSARRIRQNFTLGS